MTTVDDEVLEQVRERLRASTRVGDQRIQVGGRAGEIVLRGTVATPEEVTVAGQLAEYYATAVHNELVVDRGLREGAEPPAAGERAVTPEGEELVGGTDMFAGPGATPTEDMAQALDENEPWSPPDVPQDALTGVEERGGVPLDRPTMGEHEDLGEPDDLLTEEDRADRERPSAPDVSAAELRRAAEGQPLPSLDPTAAPPSPQAEPDTADDERTAEQRRDGAASVGPGASAEPVTGSAYGGTPAIPTRAAGADTAPEDPALGASGGVEKIPGTDRGPAPGAQEDATDEDAAREEELGPREDSGEPDTGTGRG